MKKVVLLITLLLTNYVFAQVTTSPALPTANGEITILFDATGTGLDGYTGDVYAHTGVTINGERWQNVIESWGNNTTQPKLTRTSTNQFELIITPNVYSFYNVATSETVTELNFVFRSSDGSQQTADIFVTLYEEGLNLTFTQPLNGSAYNLNSTITISAEASTNADLELFVNGISQKTTTNTISISTSYKFTSKGTYTLKATATSGSETKETEISVYIKNPTQNQTMPSGVKNGVNDNGDGTITFVLLAPNKTDVLLIGDFNNWAINENYQLYKDGEYFWITLNNLDVNTEYAYQYLVDYNIKIADPYSEKILDPWTDQYIKSDNYPNLKAYPDGLTTGYVSTFKINEENYSWNITDFAKPNQDNLIIYEMLVRDFTESDSYTEAITHLDYLASLGVNAIELMPINEFEGADSWGYNPALYMALDKSYGTKNNFKSFIDACHERGIAVLADVVFNHSYGQSPLVQMYWDALNNRPAADNPWYNQQSNFSNPDAQWGYDFNHESNYTTSFFKDVLDYWLNEYKLDGFRFDFTKGFSNTPYGTSSWGSTYDASRITILKNYADHVWNHNSTNKPFVIFEHLADNSEETELANYGIMLWGNMNHGYSQNTMGFNSETDISWISYKQRGWNNPNVVGYMESHDEERLMYKNLEYGNSSGNYNVKNLTTALSREETAGMFFFTIPGPKMIWQFGELGYDYSINTCDDGTTVSNDCRLSRKPIKWDYQNDVNRKQIFNTWATMIAFKKKYPDVFNSSDFDLNVSGLVKSIVLKHASMDVIIIGNFDVTNKSISTNFTKTGTWFEYFTGEEKSVTNTAQAFTLAPGEYKMYSTQKLLDPRGGTSTDDSDGDGVIDTEDLCPNTPLGNEVNTTGCTVFSLAATNFTIEAIGETCPDKNNGQINISAEESLNYTVTIAGKKYDFTNSSSISANDLSPGTYEFCISVVSNNYEQCYSVVIEEGTIVSGKTSISSKTATVEITEGTAPYNVFVNNKSVFNTYAPEFTIAIKHGDIVEVKTAVSCEGTYSKKINLFEEIVAYPNPTQGIFEIVLPNSKKEVIVEIYNIQSQLISSKTYPVLYGKVQLNLENNPTGLYIAKVYLDDPISLKIVKQ
ncbi:putative secreted protein (Por secretion system target) [Lutibacter oceani]|uniref:Putative secreted protein (Por secretion system target) n=1 Tax=Lutibacter oceani TaxID=1853311 RepID=A0A3D9RTL4_9FLAO|nr:alpha-amylase family glycosyl hydrolase [Lutibacter oceani]REE80035.1 putative secreted protein (Por secretion system target) [Lutibacter oceani]